MNKEKIKYLVREGLDRNRDFMMIKVKREGEVSPIVVIIPRDQIDETVNEILRDKGPIVAPEVEDILLTSYPNNLTWFIY